MTLLRLKISEDVQYFRSHSDHFLVPIAEYVLLSITCCPICFSSEIRDSDEDISTFTCPEFPFVATVWVNFFFESALVKAVKTQFFQLGNRNWTVGLSWPEIEIFSKHKGMRLGRFVLTVKVVYFFFSALCPNGQSSSSSTENSLVRADTSSFFKFWKLQYTVPFFLIVVLFPLSSVKSPTFFTKFNSLGELSIWSFRGGKW